MKITQIDLPAFRNFKGVTIPTDCSRIYICGTNNVGKTGIREAIKWGLTGRCDVTDAKGTGAEDLIPQGKREGSVALTVSGLGVVRRMINGSGSALDIDGFSGGVQVQQNGLYSKLNATPEFMAAVLDWEMFSNLHHADAKALVLSLLQIRVPVQLDQAKEPELLSLEALDLRLDRAVMERRDEKNKLKNFRVPEVPTTALPPVEKIREQLAKLRTEKDALQQQIGSTVESRKRITADMEKYPGVEDEAPDPNTETLQADIATLETKLQDLEQAVVPPPQSAAPVDDAEKTMRFYQSRSDALAQHDPKAGCVLHPSVPCKTALKEFKRQAEEDAAQVSRLVIEDRPQPAQQAPQTTMLRKSLDVLRARLVQQNESVEKFKAGVMKWRELARELQALPDTAKQEEALATLNLRILKGDQLLLDSIRYWDAVAAHEKAVGQRLKIEEAIKQLEYEVDYLGPKGARLQILDEKIKAFEAAINGVTQLWKLQVGFNVDPWEIRVNDRPFKTLSRSQRWRVGVAIQIAVASISGISLVVLDEVDMLSDENKRAAVTMAMQANVEQLFVLGTREDDDPLPSKLKGLLSHRLITNAKGDAQVAETVQG